jgi:hypothetical protein
MKDPVFRTASPYSLPSVSNPKIKILTTGTPLSKSRSSSPTLFRRPWSWSSTYTISLQCCPIPSTRLLFTPVVSSECSPWPSFSLFQQGDLLNGKVLTLLCSARPHIPHTDLEEELHETNHIDYDRVSIVCSPGPLADHPPALPSPEQDTDHMPPRLPTLPWLPSTKMPLSTKPARPSPPAVL